MCKEIKEKWRVLIPVGAGMVLFHFLLFGIMFLVEPDRHQWHSLFFCQRIRQLG